MELSLVFPHQLYANHGALSPSRPTYLLEDALFFGPDRHWPLKFHRKKLILHRASMKAYQAELETKGFEVHYIECKGESDTVECLQNLFPEPPKTIHLCDPVDDVLNRRLHRYARQHDVALNMIPSPNFLSPEEWLHEQFTARKKPFMATFYKAQRRRMDLLMENGEPLGGKWSFDEDNRKKLPKKQAVPGPPALSSNKRVDEATRYVTKHFPDAQGQAHGFSYPVDRSGAEQWLQDFLDERFSLFGDYEDAISMQHRVLFHSVLTPVLNIGLLQPGEVLDKVMQHAQRHDIPLNTIEGFIRQVVGWREFMRAMYVRHGVEERNANFWNFECDMPTCFYDASTGIDPIDETIRRVLEDAYCHHIERLMLLGNFMLLCRIHPTAVYRWFMELFIDAYDWVMVPNVYGMSQFADGGLFTTKPYLSGSNYVRKMSDYPKGPWCEVWDGLFWSFIADYQETFLKNHRMSQMGRMLNRMSDEKRTLHRKNADDFLANLK